MALRLWTDAVNVLLDPFRASWCPRQIGFAHGIQWIEEQRENTVKGMVIVSKRYGREENEFDTCWGYRDCWYRSGMAVVGDHGDVLILARRCLRHWCIWLLVIARRAPVFIISKSNLRLFGCFASYWYFVKQNFDFVIEVTCRAKSTICRGFQKCIIAKYFACCIFVIPLKNACEYVFVIYSVLSKCHNPQSFDVYRKQFIKLQH